MFVEYLAKAHTATNVIGMEQHENDMAQRLTGMVDLNPKASVTGIATGAKVITVIV